MNSKRPSKSLVARAMEALRHSRSVWDAAAHLIGWAAVKTRSGWAHWDVGNAWFVEQSSILWTPRSVRDRGFVVCPARLSKVDVFLQQAPGRVSRGWVWLDAMMGWDRGSHSSWFGELSLTRYFEMLLRRRLRWRFWGAVSGCDGFG